MSERVIRYWKKIPTWEQERQKLIDERAEIMELDKAEKRAEYKENLERQEQNLEILMEQIFANTMRAITLSNRVLAIASLMDDPLKACLMVVKSGALKHSKVAFDGVSAYIAIMNHLHQFHILIEYFEGLEEEE